MTTCEFKEECNEVYPKEWKQANGCDEKVIKQCQIRKFAILVVNRTVEKFWDEIEASISKYAWNHARNRKEALKMEEE